MVRYLVFMCSTKTKTHRWHNGNAIGGSPRHGSSSVHCRPSRIVDPGLVLTLETPLCRRARKPSDMRREAALRDKMGPNQRPVTALHGVSSSSTPLRRCRIPTAALAPPPLMCIDGTHNTFAESTSHCRGNPSATTSVCFCVLVSGSVEEEPGLGVFHDPS